MQSWTISTPDMKRKELQADVDGREDVPAGVANLIADLLESIPAARVVNIQADGRDDGEGLIEVRIAIDGRVREG